MGLLDARIVAAVDEVARSHWGRAPSPTEVAESVAALSRTYTRDRAAIDLHEHTRDGLLARLCFFLPRDLMKVVGPLDELLRRGALGRRDVLRVLDLGAGLGTTTFGCALHARLHSVADRLEVDLVDHEARTLALAESVAAALARHDAPLLPIKARSVVGDYTRLQRLALKPPYDLVLLGLTLNEWLDDHESTHARAVESLEWAATQLTDTGAIVVIEPALKATARRLHAVRDLVVARGGLHVLAPCLGAVTCPMLEGNRDWCHAERELTLPKALASIARASGLRFERLTYSYLVLRRVPSQPFVLEGAGATADTRVVRIVSEPLVSKGRRDLFACHAEGRTRLVRLDRHATASNTAFTAGDRDSLLAVSPWRGGHEARIGPDTVVGQLPRVPAQSE